MPRANYVRVEIRECFENLKTYENPLDALKKFGCDFLANNEDENLIVKDFGREYLAKFFEKGIAQGIFRKGNSENYGDIFWSFLLGKLLPVKKGNENKSTAICIEEILSVFEK